MSIRRSEATATLPGEISDLPDPSLASGGPIAASLRELGLVGFHDACRHVQALPYGRTRGGASTVIAEGQGTCNSKHALLVMLARELGSSSVQLGLGMFELSGEGFPGVARVLADAGIPCMLEAHCYLVCGRVRVDLTWPIEQAVPHPRFLHESTIDPDELPEGKIRRHRASLETWLAERNWSMSIERAWQIREACIAALSQPS
jgi:hypothetical protein